MEIIQEILNWLAQSDSMGKWVALILPILISICSLVAAIIPTPKEGTVWAKVYKIIVDIPAINIGKAKD